MTRIALLLLFLAAIQAVQAEWRLVGEGDCPGRQIVGSEGVEPDESVCTAQFAGKTALCFTQVCYPGCQYIDVATQDCRGGGEMAQVYTCEPKRSGATAIRGSAAPSAGR